MRLKACQSRNKTNTQKTRRRGYKNGIPNQLADKKPTERTKTPPGLICWIGYDTRASTSRRNKKVTPTCMILYRHSWHMHTHIHQVRSPQEATRRSDLNMVLLPYVFPRSYHWPLLPPYDILCIPFIHSYSPRRAVAVTVK